MAVTRQATVTSKKAKEIQSTSPLFPRHRLATILFSERVFPMVLSNLDKVDIAAIAPTSLASADKCGREMANNYAWNMKVDTKHTHTLFRGNTRGEYGLYISQYGKEGDQKVTINEEKKQVGMYRDRASAETQALRYIQRHKEHFKKTAKESKAERKTAEAAVAAKHFTHIKYKDAEDNVEPGVRSVSCTISIQEVFTPMTVKTLVLTAKTDGSIDYGAADNWFDDVGECYRDIANFADETEITVRIECERFAMVQDDVPISAAAKKAKTFTSKHCCGEMERYDGGRSNPRYCNYDF
eukprot:CAMPEP_0171729168 /NCGR_PEP_ID=MMETSP0991-20121206/27442_1 /TAXON_ID=483369 /ORGANISM="non described non described, Strain CCMP2098" /LENGTH=296 /DNA_ID=CAMNT_0012323473 /DNA_START=113 /DNA_END=1003 /DNA_ORIENTATION=-